MADESYWQKCSFPLFARRDVISGGWIGDKGGAQAFRRKRNGKWEYSQDADVCDTWAESQMG